MNDEPPWKPGRILEACGFKVVAVKDAPGGAMMPCQAATLFSAKPFSGAHYIREHILMLSEEMNRRAEQEPDRYERIKAKLAEAGVQVIILDHRVDIELPPAGGEVPGLMSIDELRRDVFVNVGVPEPRQPSYLDHDPTKNHSRRRKQHRGPRYARKVFRA